MMANSTLTAPSVRRTASNSAGRYAVAVGSVLCAFGIRYWLRPVLGEELPFMFFIAASLVAAWQGGARTGMVALVLGLLLSDYFFIAPTAGTVFSNPIELARVTRYILTASIGIFLIEVLHRGRRRTEMMVDELKHEVERRKESEAALRAAEAQLAAHAGELERRVRDRTAHLRATIDSLEGLLYHMAHNLRAPLRAMEGFAVLLQGDYAPHLDEAGKDYARRISAGARRMDLLLQDLLDYGRLGHMEVSPARINLDEALNTVLSRLAETIRVHDAEINLRPPLPAVWADAQLLERVLFNLLDNALKFVAPGVALRIQIWSEGRGPVIRLWIQDNGIGIEQRYFSRIFEPFETLGPPGTGESTGIGLAVVAKSMERMRGKAGVESTPGEGSRFWLEFCPESPDVVAPGATE